MIFGTDTGMYIARISKGEIEDDDNCLDSFLKVLDLEKVFQVEVLSDFGIVIVLAGIKTPTLI